MTTIEQQSTEYYTPQEIEFLDKYTLIAENLLDDEELYEIITKYDFNEEKIKKEVLDIVKSIQKRGDDYEWGEVKNGKKKVKKEETKNSNQWNKKGKPRKERQNKNFNDSQTKALQEEDQINYVYNRQANYRGRGSRGGRGRGRGNSSYNYYDKSYQSDNRQGNYYSNRGGRGGYKNQRETTKKTESNNIVYEFNEHGQIIPKSIVKDPEQYVSKEDNTSESYVVINEIAESQANLNKKESPVKEYKTNTKKSSPVKPQKKVEEKKPSPDKKPSPVKKPQVEAKINQNVVSSNETGFNYSTEPKQSPIPTPQQQPQQQNQFQNFMPPQMFPLHGMEGMNPGGFPGFFPMFPFNMDPEAMKASGGFPQQINQQIDPKIQQQMNMNYYAMMNNMYMQMMMYKNMMNTQGNPQDQDQFNQMFGFGKK